MAADEPLTEANEREAAAMALDVANELLATTNQRLSKLYETAHQFVDEVAHEFRTPLTVIKEFASIMDEGLIGELNAEQHDYLRVICARVDDLNGLVNDMLDLSRLEAGLISVARRRCALADVVARVQTTLTRRAHAGNIPFTVAVGDDLPPLYCDPEKVGRVIINLAVNAFKYGGDCGAVELWARRSSDCAKVIVGITDRGPGIPADKLEVIFERFRQAGSARDTAKGFGLGLSIVRELVDLNLGELSVESQLGRGTTFSFSLPVFDPPGIVARYVSWLARRRPALFFVADIGIVLREARDEATAEECDALLQQQLQEDELLLRLGTASWTLLTADRQDAEVRTRARVLQSRFAEHAAEIDSGLPEIDVRPTGIWRLPGQMDAVVNRFRLPSLAMLARQSA